MKRIQDGRRWWPGVVLALAIVALWGPWGFDRVNVPAQYECSPPNIRLEGDYCGVPLRGTWLITMTAQTFKSLPAAWLRGEPGLSGGAAEILIAALPFFLVLPLLTTLGRIVRDGSRRWRRVNLVAWSLGLVVAGLMATVGLVSGWGPLRGWGVWLYVGLAMGMVIAEARSGRISGRPQIEK